jgi:serine/threonine protein kinase
VLIPQVSGSDYNRELASYNGRERVVLRKRRTKLRVEHFRIIAQVGQGGYGSVYLARKNDSNEVCALKKMRKGTLAKMDEVKHVLVERDILTAVKTPWLVRLLYAFQDREHVYLAMVRRRFRLMRRSQLISIGIRTRWRLQDFA